MKPSSTYKSTRGGENGKSFEDVLLSAYASDGGLYVPHALPMIGFETLCEWSTYSLSQICAEIIALFTDFDVELLREMTLKAFSTFNGGNSPPLPMTRVGNLIFLDTSHGPTLSFKDVGQQVVAQLLNYVLGKRGKKAKIIVETSGDTGPAAISGVKNCPNIEIFCLYPYQRVSDIQELQMITVMEENVHVYRTEGDSDEQASVLKELFRDEEFMRNNNICSINSINWARVMTQSSYYIWSYLQVYPSREQIGQPLSFCVPTGAFGNAMGGYLAKRIGLPISRIVCATNENDIVHRTLSTGDMNMSQNKATVSPAMDIQFAYNLERLLYYMLNENTSFVKPIMDKIEIQYSLPTGSSGIEGREEYTVQLDVLLVNKMKEVFLSQSVSDEDTLSTIREYWHLLSHPTPPPATGSSSSSLMGVVSDDNDDRNVNESDNDNVATHLPSSSGYLLCPHSAISVHVANQLRLNRTEKEKEKENHKEKEKMVCVLTAHPAKFHDTILKALQPTQPQLEEEENTSSSSSIPLPTLPSYVEELKSLPQRYTWLKKTCEDSSSSSSHPSTSSSSSLPFNWRAAWINKIRTDVEQIL